MQITHLGHSTVLVEVADVAILIDPGNFSDAWTHLRGLDAVLVTHQHPDHVDTGRLGVLREANPRAEVWLEPQTAALHDIPGGHPLAPGRTVMIGPVRVRAVGGEHACIHPDIPLVGNVGLVLSAEAQPTFFHPGDCLTEIPEGIEVLAIPAYGPWAAMKETIDFVRAVDAGQGFLIHDGLLNERGRTLVFDRLTAMTGTSMLDLREGSGHVFAR